MPLLQKKVGGIKSSFSVDLSRQESSVKYSQVKKILEITALETRIKPFGPSEQQLAVYTSHSYISKEVGKHWTKKRTLIDTYVFLSLGNVKLLSQANSYQ